MTRSPAWYAKPGRLVVHGVPEGFDALVLADAARAVVDQQRSIIHVARDDARTAHLAEALAFFAPDVEILQFPAWDCQPYDRVSPKSDLVSQRLETLSRLAVAPKATKPRVVITTVVAILQRVVQRSALEGAVMSVAIGQRVDTGKLIGFFGNNGYNRTDTVREPGEFAVRGGIIDVFPTGAAEPLRLDFFGDTLDALRSFDPLSQLSTGTHQSIEFKPVSEIMLDEAAIARFRSGYRALFGSETGNDALYQAVTSGRKHIGMEHWLPLFHEHLDTLFDHTGPGPGR